MPCEFEVKIGEKKGHARWELDHAGRLIFHPTYPELSEDANKELIKNLAESIGVSHSKVRIIHGIEDHNKMIKITDHAIALEEIYHALGVTKV